MATKSKYVSGYCLTGFHEGQIKKTVHATEVQGCHSKYGCTCNCHAEFMEIRQELGLPTSIPVAPMPRPAPESDDATLFVSPQPMMGLELKRTAPGIAPAAERTFDSSSATGRKARGELEYLVKSVCDRWLLGDVNADALTPTVIALEIEEGKPPSVGAIAAIFDRWTSYGFAVIEAKPIRFIMYTAEGVDKGLEFLKEKFKREKKLKLTARVRGKGV